MKPLRLHSMLRSLMVITLLTLAVRGMAQDDFFSDVATSTESQTSDDGLQFKGYWQQKFKYGTQVPDTFYDFERDEKGIKQIRSDVFAELSGDINDSVSFRVGAKGEVNYVKWDNRSLEWDINDTELFLKNAYLDIVFANQHWLRLGHQIISWGESESLAITDVLSPYDYREFGQAELRDIREHVPALLYSVPVTDDNLTFVATWNAGHNRHADEDDEFYPYIGFATAGVATSEVEPEHDWEAAVKYEKHLNGSDLRVVVAEVNDNEFFVRPIPLNVSPFLAVELHQARVQVIAATANKVLGSWLLKTEVGRHKDKLEADLNGQPVATDQWRGMAGLEYSGINDWLFSLEVNGIKVRNAPQNFDSDAKQSAGAVARVQHSAWNERFTQQLWFMQLAGDEGRVLRWDLNYDWSDHWAFDAAVVLYQNSNTDSSLYPFRNNDSINVSATYHF